MNAKKLFLCILVAILVCTPIAAVAAGSYREEIDAALSHLQGELSLQALIDGPMAEAAGTGMDDCIIGLNHSVHELDLSKYIGAAALKLNEGTISNPVTRQRCALSLLSCGAQGRMPSGIVDESAGKLGIMSYVYALHLINNGADSKLWTKETLTDKLFSLRKDDGGWAIMGNSGDPDVTAMCLQALSAAGLTAKDERIDHALLFLSERQLESGGFKSYGDENAESAAQVIIALASLGIDPDADERFIKNGKSALDALKSFELPGGGYAHLNGGDESETAVLQALQAFTALEQIGNPYYDFSREKVLTLNEGAGRKMPVWKVYAYSLIAAAGLASCIFALRRRHGRIKRMLFAFILSLAAAVAVHMINIETATGYYNPETNNASIGEVYIAIFCDTVTGIGDDASIPEDGVILEKTAIPIQEGESVFDVLIKAARTNELHMEHEGGTGDMAYVNGINYLYEFVHGDLSGWMYEVNGESPSIGGGAYKVQPGDEIIWRYTTELGEDLK